MASTISAGTTTTTSLVYTADTSGVLQLQTNGTTTAVTIDTSQNVGVGVTPNSWTNGKAIELGISGNALWSYTATNSTYLSNNVYFNSTSKFAGNGYAAYYHLTNGSFVWETSTVNNVSGAGVNATTNATMTLDNIGNLYLGNSSQIASGKQSILFNQGVNQGIAIQNSNNSNSGYFCYFLNSSGTAQGSIYQSSSSLTVFSTTSDRRLKSNITSLTTKQSGSIIDALQPRQFTWNSDGSTDVGFIADEIQTLIPKAVVGEPNATKEEEYEVTPAIKDEQGNITTPAVMGTRTVPVYQMIDSSIPEIIAYLVAEVQSLRARLKAANIA